MPGRILTTCVSQPMSLPSVSWRPKRSEKDKRMQIKGLLVIRQDTVLEPGVYDLPKGILIEGDN